MTYCVCMCSSSRMRYVAAYLLAVLGGNDKPSESDIKKILSSVGIDADSVCLKKVISELKDKNVDEVISAGKSSVRVYITTVLIAQCTIVPCWEHLSSCWCWRSQSVCWKHRNSNSHCLACSLLSDQSWSHFQSPVQYLLLILAILCL